MAQLTVSMPHWRSPTLRRAVLSVLGQSYRDLTLVVVNDGDPPGDVWPQIADIDDRRLIRYDLPALSPGKTYGRYFIDTFVSEAARTPWFTCHDSDDWSMKQRYLTMRKVVDKHSAAGRTVDVVPAGEQIHPADPRYGRLRYRRPVTAIPTRNRGPIPHMWHISAMYRTEVFRGFIHPGFRVGWDSLMSSMLAAAPDVTVQPCNAVHYHRVGREDSLTRHPDTGIGSPYRQRVVRVLAGLWDEYRVNPSTDTARQLIDRTMTTSIVGYVSQHAANLAAKL